MLSFSLRPWVVAILIDRGSEPEKIRTAPDALSISLVDPDPGEEVYYIASPFMRGAYGIYRVYIARVISLPTNMRSF